MNLYAYPSLDDKTGFIYGLVAVGDEWRQQDEAVNMGVVEVRYNHEDLTEEQLVLKSIETLMDKQKHIRAQAEFRADKLQHMINNLRAITYQKGQSENENCN